MLRLSSSPLLALWIATSASAVTMAWTPIGNPGNPADDTGYGFLSYSYYIGTYEVTNAQYAEFLNAKAKSDPFGLYNPSMCCGGYPNYGSGLTRSGSPGSYTYAPAAGRENRPVDYVSLYDAMRFANRMNNGQVNADTETGAYRLLGGTPTPTNQYVARNINGGATIMLPLENEWYKAAYYNPATASYFDYPTRSNSPTNCVPGGSSLPNTANCGSSAYDFMPVGSYTGSASPYGTFDQGGNVYEWNEAFNYSAPTRGVRGGWVGSSSYELAAWSRYFNNPSLDYPGVGIRLVMLPEASTAVLVLMGLIGISGWRRARA